MLPVRRGARTVRTAQAPDVCEQPVQPRLRGGECHALRGRNHAKRSAPKKIRTRPSTRLRTQPDYRSQVPVFRRSEELKRSRPGHAESEPRKRPASWNQRLRACVLNPSLREECRQVANPVNLPETVRSYFTNKEPELIALLFPNTEWNVEHIRPESTAGAAGHCLENLCLMEADMKQYFSNTASLLENKRSYIGDTIYDHAIACVKHTLKKPTLTS